MAGKLGSLLDPGRELRLVALFILAEVEATDILLRGLAREEGRIPSGGSRWATGGFLLHGHAAAHCVAGSYPAKGMKATFQPPIGSVKGWSSA